MMCRLRRGPDLLQIRGRAQELVEVAATPTPTPIPILIHSRYPPRPRVATHTPILHPSKQLRNLPPAPSSANHPQHFPPHQTPQQNRAHRPQVQVLASAPNQIHRPNVPSGSSRISPPTRLIARRRRKQREKARRERRARKIRGRNLRRMDGLMRNRIMLRLRVRV
jgi:hypothetical protein